MKKQNKSQFRDEKHTYWSKIVRERDGFRCQICGATNTQIHAHHLNCWSDFLQDRYSIGNGISLCFKCHSLYHSIYGKGMNDKHQFAQFKKLIEVLQKLSKDAALKLKK